MLLWVLPVLLGINVSEVSTPMVIETAAVTTKTINVAGGIVVTDPKALSLMAFSAP